MMKRYLILTLGVLLLLGFFLGCVTSTPTESGNRTCSVDHDCVPQQCCHPTSCIHHSYKGVCTELCTNVCEGPIDCGAGHCGCEAGTCQVLPGPSPAPTFIAGIGTAYPPF
jgi:hypothetical protein